VRPAPWCASGVLEVQGREHAERRVAADAVVEGFDVLEDLAGEFAPGRPGAAVDEFLLERREERFGGGGVVIAVAFGAHRARDAGVAGGLAGRE
jgi:hypothetical protein